MLVSIITATNDARWLRDLWTSIKHQAGPKWQWVVSVNAAPFERGELRHLASEVRRVVEGDLRVKVVVDDAPSFGVGASKKFAFGHGDGDVLMEVDHDDVLLPGAVKECALAFLDPDVGFAYSDFTDVVEEGAPTTYADPTVRQGWMKAGYEFYEADAGPFGPREFARSFPPSALSFSLVYYAPNHFRAWRRSAYDLAGGHDARMSICDDHDLLARTYLVTKCKHVPLPLYAYRVSGRNTWHTRQEEIGRLTREIKERYLEKLVLRECELRRLPVYDLGGAISPRAGWKVADLPGMGASEGVTVHAEADLRERWPFSDSSVGAFRASDFLGQLPDKQHAMSEIWRCLAPGGWLLSWTPSTDGRGAWADPTHVSYWNQDSFAYWTRAEKARYVRNTAVKFLEVDVETKTYGDVPYVVAHLCAIKPGMQRLPGEVKI